MPHEDPDAVAVAVAEHLQATAERPMEASARRWIGEAEAVAVDLSEGDVEESVIRDRLGHVVDLLANVESTGDPEADDHVREARTLAESIQSEES